MILIISSPDDIHAKPVMQSLEARGIEAFMLDFSEYPQKYHLSISFDGTSNRQKYMLSGEGREIDLADFRVVWWRRPQYYNVHPEITAPEDRSFAYIEAHSAWSGLLLALDNVFWINHPTREEEGSRKVYQLRVAQEIGLRIPDTCITSDPRSAEAFIDKHGSGNVIYKAFSGTEKDWRETRMLKENEVAMIDGVKYAPVIFQEYIPGSVDLRITVIGDEIFAGAIYTENASYKVDFRMVMDEAELRAFELPAALKKQLLQYMRRMNLVYGAIDMRLTPDGEYVFLEVNPSGQWLFVEVGTGLKITDSLVGLMAAKSEEGSQAPAGRSA